MGSAFVAGGVVHSQQTFNKHGINVNCGLLILSGGTSLEVLFLHFMLEVADVFCRTG
jgi:Ca2+/H+ antiporter